MKLNLGIIKIQDIYRSKTLFKKKIYNSLDTILKQCHSINRRIEQSKVDKIITEIYQNYSSLPKREKP